jgi:galactose mutarotase-like enzyme
LRFRGNERLALPGGLPALRRGATLGLPLLAPWANRLATRRYRAAGIDVDLTRLRVPTDANGLPMHGLLVGKPGWEIDACEARGDAARVRASIGIDAPAFPFPHRLTVTVTAIDNELRVATTIVPSGHRRVPIAFGWHPYLRLPGTARRTWHLRLPGREHRELDPRGIPTGASSRERAEASPIGSRTFDDLYALGRAGGVGRRLALEGAGGAAVELRCGTGYPFAQIWVPAGRPFAALEPMTAPTNALGAGTASVVSPGDSFTATFSLVLS